MEPPECEVCWLPYNTKNKRPLVGSCGHGICKECFPNLRTRDCFKCKVLSAFAHPAPNFDLIKVLEGQLKENRGQSDQVRSQIQQDSAVAPENTTFDEEFALSLALSEDDSLIQEPPQPSAPSQSAGLFDILGDAVRQVATSYTTPTQPNQSQILSQTECIRCHNLTNNLICLQCMIDQYSAQRAVGNGRQFVVRRRNPGLSGFFTFTGLGGNFK